VNKLIFRILYWEINNEEESILFSRHDFPVITPGIRTVRPNLGGRKLRIIVFGAHPDHRYTGILMQDAGFMEKRKNTERRIYAP